MTSIKLAVAWLGVVIIALIVALSKKPQFDSSLVSLLPVSERNPAVHKVKEILNKQFEDNLVLILQGSEVDTLKTAVKNVAVSFTKLPYVGQVKWQVGAEIDNQIPNDHAVYRFGVLDPSVTTQLYAGDFEKITQNALSEILSPLASSSLSIIEDPFGLERSYLRDLEMRVNIATDDKLMKVRGSELPTYVIIISFSESIFEPNLQSDLLDRLALWSEKLANQDIRFWKSGMVVHAATGADQAKSEISTIGVGSLIGIVLCVFFVFRKIYPVFLLLLPVAIGSLFAFSIAVLVFDRVHLITLAFGAGLIGVSIDYSLHYLCERHVTPSDKILQKLLPGMLLGLFTSLVAYAAQALAPFPGLQQMALFSVVGLSGAWLTVMLWFPLLTSTMRLQPLGVATRLADLKEKLPRLDRHSLLSYIFILLGIFSLLMVYLSEKSVDVRVLQTSPRALLEEDLKVQSILGITSSSRFILVHGDNLEECLQLEETLKPKLEDMTSKGEIGGYSAVSQNLPSLRQQKKNILLVRELYEQNLGSLFGTLGLDEAIAAKSEAILMAQKDMLLTYDQWRKMPESSLHRQNIIRLKDQVYTVIRLKGVFSQNSGARLEELAQELEGIQYVDHVDDISSLLGSYQKQVLFWVILSYLIISTVLYVRYKHDCWRIIFPPCMACLLSLSVVIFSEGFLNIFHLMAIILVIGIGLDMGIFMAENNHASHTWLAATLSCYTSLVAFGLLTLSETKVLYHFGLTVLVGLIAVWLISPLVRVSKSSSVA